MRIYRIVLFSLTLSACGGGGGSESPAPASPVVQNAAPSGSVRLVGNAIVGETLTMQQDLADANGLGPFSYQWWRGQTPINGATASSYQLQTADIGFAISLRISYVDGNQFAEQVSSAATALVIAAPVAATAPNVLLIIADDLGLDASNQFSLSADRPKTPNLDALAKQGIVFENVWATPACTTTRGSLITGQHGVHSGINYVPAKMDPNSLTLQRYLSGSSAKQAYQTAVVGKWHLAGATPDYQHPTDSGVGYYAGNISGVLPDYYQWPLVQNGKSSTSAEYHSSKVTDLAIDWLGQQQQPWFLWLAYAAPHTPFHLPPAHLLEQTTLSGSTADINARPRAYYLAAIEAMDSEIGRLLASMSAEVRANTLVMFIGDNGTPTQVVDTQVFSQAHSKNSLYEGGIRVPLIIAGKGVSRQNAREAALINTTDFFATIASLTGNPLPASTSSDSISFAPLLDGSGSAARQFNYSEFESTDLNAWTVRNQQYKLFQHKTGEQQLYDLTKDLNEQQDLLKTSGNYSAVVTELADYGNQLRQSAGKIDITDRIFSKRSTNCADYAASYQSTVQDVHNQTTFHGDLSIAVQAAKCVFQSNAIPNHHFNDGNRSFPNPVSAQNSRFSVTSIPKKAATMTAMSLQLDNAILLNGVKVDLLAAGCFNVGNGKIGCNDPAQPWRYDPMFRANGFEVDSHNAHAQPDGTYHYHGTPNAFYVAASADALSPVVGFSADGFPIYGPYIWVDGVYRKATSSYQLKAGARPGGNGNPGGNYDGAYRDDYQYVAGSGDLDQCNGMTYQGSYGYYITDRFPYVLNCFQGTPDSSFYK